MAADGGVDNLVAHGSKKFMEALYDTTLGNKLPFRHFEPYVTSFCGHTNSYDLENGLLSQWRGYGRESGYALAFDCKGLYQAIETECDSYFFSSAQLGSVIYDGDEQGFDKEFSELIGLIKKLTEQMLREPDAVKFGPLLPPFLSSISRFKHQGFKEEQEVRLVASPMSLAFVNYMEKTDSKFKDVHAGKEIKLREFRSNLASYISFGGGNKRLPITRIIVGPHIDQKIRQKRLKMYLELQGLAIDVSCSQTPLLAGF